VSNDIFGGSFILDADVTVTMTEGAAADCFDITLVNLPAASISLLRSRNASAGLTATVHLGYFDEPASRTGSRPVITGRVTSVESTLDDDGRSRTVIRGQEKAGYLLRTTPVAHGKAAGPLATLEFVKSLLAGPDVTLAPGSTMQGTLRDYTAKAGSVLAELQSLAGRDGSALVVRDGAVHLGAAVGRRPAPVVFDPATNIVLRGDGQKEATRNGTQPASALADGAQAKQVLRTSLELTVLGHPGLRVGQTATVTGLEDVPAGPLRTARVVHRFTTRAGYTCEVLLVAVPAGQPAQTGGGVQGVIDRMQDVVSQQRDDHPAIDVGAVTSYQPGAEGKHLTSLHYGQTPGPTVVAPSVASQVDTAVELHAKPLASPFAFHKCGLVLPVYPGMRALLAHNCGLVNDAVVAGWLWGEAPRHEPPANKFGDYWLALPTAIGNDGLPTGGGVNDLVDATGRRVVQVKALHVMVGERALPPVGARPDPMPEDNTLTIEHHSGTKITVDAEGALTITTSSKKLSLSNGAVSVTLNGAKVEVF
jgi:hypothetical protein